MGLKCTLGFHKWNGCKCSVCGKTRDEGRQINPKVENTPTGINYSLRFKNKYFEMFGYWADMDSHPLCKAILSGDRLAAINEINKYPNVESAFIKDDKTPLQFASYTGCFSIVEYLLNKGANPDCGASDKSPLIFACMAASYEKTGINGQVKKIINDNSLLKKYDAVVKILIEHGAKVNKDKNTIMLYSPLYFAAHAGLVELVALLIQAGALFEDDVFDVAAPNVHSLIRSSQVDKLPSNKSQSSLELPPELISSERIFDVHAALRKMTPQRIKEVCSTIPTTNLDLSSPGSNPKMKDAVQTAFCVASYVINNGVTRDVADLVILPLVARIEFYGSGRLHPELGAAEVFNLAVAMAKTGRETDALRILNVLSDTVVKLQCPVLFLKYMIHHNRAHESRKREDINRALVFYEGTPELHDDPKVKQAVDYLKKMNH